MIRDLLFRRRRGHIVSEQHRQAAVILGRCQERPSLEREGNRFREDSLVKELGLEVRVIADMAAVGIGVLFHDPVFPEQQGVQGQERVSDSPGEDAQVLFPSGLLRKGEFPGETLVGHQVPDQGDPFERLFPYGFVRNAVQGEDIDEYAPIPVSALLDDDGACVVDLGEIQGIIGGVAGPDGLEMVVPILFQEPVVIRPRHPDVDVVVPGDEALMPDRPEQGSEGQVIPGSVLFTPGVDIGKDVHHGGLHLGRSELFFHGLSSVQRISQQ